MPSHVNIIALLSVLLVLPEAAYASFKYYVSDRADGGVWVIEDLNGDGDALDTGEKLLWANGFSQIAELEYDGGSIYAIEEGLTDGSNKVIRLTDFNDDGDALDFGEQQVWADNLDDPRGITRDTSGSWYISEVEDSLVWQLRDLNADGDVLDANERVLYANDIPGALSIMPFAEGILVSAYIGHEIHYLIDLNLDGDALDTNENRVIVSSASYPVGLLDDNNDGFYFCSYTSNTVFHASDRNGDGDMLDVVEVLSYADYVYGGIDGPWGMAEYHAGGFLLADFDNERVLWVQDINGDGDALDLGETQLFADGFNLPVDIVAVGCIDGDLNCDGFVGLDDLDIVLMNWNQNVPPGNPLADPSGDGYVGLDDLDIVLNNWNAGTPPIKEAPNLVPEPSTLVLMFLGFCCLLQRQNR